MAKRAAVVIGVDKTGGGLDPLNAAALCARRVETWLTNEGFDVICLTDDGGQPVTVAAVKAAIKSFVGVPITCDQLVVYFSGHGQFHGYSDHWLLTDAPEDVDEAVDLEQAMFLARRSGIKNVVFISDACRSVPGSATASKVNGSALFPNHATIPGYSKVDFIKATAEGTSAWEGTLNGQPWSVLTKAWMQAYQTPTPDMVKQLDRPGGPLHVVPNRRLEAFLKKEVNRLLYKLKIITAPQDIEVTIPSPEDVYIATCPPPPPEDPNAVEKALDQDDPAEAMATLSVGADASAALTRGLTFRGLGASDDRHPMAVFRMDTQMRVEANRPTPEVRHFETGCGFTVRGDSVREAWTQFGWTEPGGRRGPDEDIDAVRVAPDGDVSPTLIEFDSGRGVLLPAFRGQIAHLNVTAEGVASVSYVPSEYDPRFAAYADRQDHLDRLRALAALSSEARNFHFNSEREASDFISQFWFDDWADPALSIYAGYALAELSAMDMLNRLFDMTAGLLGVPLPDHLVLLDDASGFGAPITPPLLTRGWALWGLNGLEVDPVHRRARQYLCPSLWTTFEPEGMAILKDGFSI